MSNDLDPDQDRRSVGPDMGSNRLQMLHVITRRQNSPLGMESLQIKIYAIADC